MLHPLKPLPKAPTPLEVLAALAQRSAYRTNTHLVCGECRAWAPLGPTRSKGGALELLPHDADCPFKVLSVALEGASA